MDFAEVYARIRKSEDSYLETHKDHGGKFTDVNQVSAFRRSLNVAGLADDVIDIASAVAIHHYMLGFATPFGSREEVAVVAAHYDFPRSDWTITLEAP